ncbi:MAG: response regulator [Actinomycetota bacterium]|nr:response regulator [Actinomycetota bacterium]
MSGANTITVFLADDNLIVRMGVRALLAREDDFEVVGEAADYDELLAGAVAAAPQVLVSDIRMPPTFQREGIEAAKELRKRHPGTGVVILSQYDDPEYAIALLGEGAAGYAYLLKDRLAEGDQLAQAVRTVAAGGTALDPAIVNALVSPVTSDGDLRPEDEELLRLVAEGRPIKGIAAARGTTPEAVANAVERLFLELAQGASSGTAGSLRRLRLLHQAIVDREEQGETLSRLLPGGLAEKLRREGRHIGESEEVEVSVLMSDVRGYSGIAELTDPLHLASQLNEHRAQMNRAILGLGGTVMQFVGDAVMAVFGAPVAQELHAQLAVAAAADMHTAQEAVNVRWQEAGLLPWLLGIGVSTGQAAAALLGSEERLEYTLVGDTVNMAQRLQDLARPSGTVLSEQTYAAVTESVEATAMEPVHVKGRATPVSAWKIPVISYERLQS